MQLIGFMQETYLISWIPLFDDSTPTWRLNKGQIFSHPSTFLKKICTYAAQFISRCLSQDDIQDLDKQAQNDLKITVLRHQLNILRLLNLSQQKQPMTADGIYQSQVIAKVHQLWPSLNYQMLLLLWQCLNSGNFLDWDVYITILASEGTAHLFSACDDAVQNSFSILINHSWHSKYL